MPLQAPSIVHAEKRLELLRFPDAGRRSISSEYQQSTRMQQMNLRDVVNVGGWNRS